MNYYAWACVGVGDTVWSPLESYKVPLINTFVTVSGAGSMNGSSWANAFPGTHIQAAIDAATKEVRIAGGLYNAIQPFDNYSTLRITSAKNDLKISGAWDPVSGVQKPSTVTTTLHATDNRRVLYLEGASPTVSYVTITGANTLLNELGGGIYVSATASNTLIENCIIANNRMGGRTSNGDGGGGIYVASNSVTVTINSCLIINNQCANNGSAQAWGGGVCVQNSNSFSSNTTLNYSTVAGNSAGGNESARTGVQNVHANNCIFWRNGSNNGGVANNQGHLVNVRNSAYSAFNSVTTPAPNTNVIITNDNTPAKFVNPNLTLGNDPNWANYDWRLNLTSVLASSSNLSLSPGVTTDMIGMPRINASWLGVYEKNTWLSGTGSTACECILENGVFTLKTQHGQTSCVMADYAANSPAPWENWITNMETLIIMEGVQHIGNYAFAYCANLTDIYSNPALPPAISLTTDSPFHGVPNSVNVHVSCDKAPLYASSNWGTVFPNIQGIAPEPKSVSVKIRQGEIYVGYGLNVNTQGTYAGYDTNNCNQVVYVTLIVLKTHCQ